VCPGHHVLCRAASSCLMDMDDVHSAPARFIDSGVKGGGEIVPPLPLRSDREFLDNFCIVFVSFVSRLNHKIRVSRLMPSKTTSNLSIWDKK